MEWTGGSHPTTLGRNIRCAEPKHPMGGRGGGDHVDIRGSLTPTCFAPLVLCREAGHVDRRAVAQTLAGGLEWLWSGYAAELRD